MTPYCTCYRNWWEFLDCNMMVSPEVIPLYLQLILIPVVLHTSISQMHQRQMSCVVASSGYTLPIYYGHIQNTKKVSHHNKSAWNSTSRCIQCSSCFVFVARSIMHCKISCHFESRYMHERVSPINDSNLCFFCSCIALASAWSIYSSSSGNLISPFSVSSTIPKNGNTATTGTLYLVDF